MSAASDAIKSVLSDCGIGVVLVDVGASGGAPTLWAPLAPHATYVGFDPDLREIRRDTAGSYRAGLIINKAVCDDPRLEHVAFFLTENPYCSSMLEPDSRGLSPYSFAPLFRVSQRTTVPATTLNAVVDEHALGQIDWLKLDAQGADLRIYGSLRPDLRNRLLALDTEPGLIDAYRNEDLFVDVHRRLRADGFWLSHVDIRGVPRISEHALAELGIPIRSGVPDPARCRLRSSPGWCEARYLRTVESMRDLGLGQREFLVAWGFAMLDGQYGHALEIARAVRDGAGVRSLGTRLWASASDALRAPQPGADSLLLPSFIARQKRRMLPVLSALAVALIAAIWLILATIANSDLVEGRHVLHMDEMLVHDETAKIVNADSPRELAKALVGNDQRYGRTLWYVAALASEIPERLFGESGQIVATRIALSLCLLAAYLVFAYTWVRSELLRPLCFAALLTVPATSYFATTPKPEPVQMLLLSAFFWMFLIRGDHTKSWSLYGAAFGTKINALVVAPALAVFWWLRQKRENGAALKTAALASAWFLLGFVLAVPVVLSGRGGIRTYLGWTFRNTGHDADDPGVGPVAWVRFTAEGFFGAPSALGYALVGVLLAVPVALLVRRGREAIFEPVAALYACGILLLLSIAFGVERLWGHYLFPGVVLLYVAAFASIDGLFAFGIRARRLAIVALAILMAATVIGVSRELQQFLDLSRRTSQSEHTSKLSEYDAVMQELSQIAARKQDLLRVAVTPHMYRPPSTAAWSVTPFWGPFLDWRTGYDVIVMYKNETTEAKSLSPNPETRDRQVESRLRYQAHTNRECTEPPCYVAHPLRDGDLVILVRRSE